MVLQVFVFKQGEFVGSDNFTAERVLIGRDSDIVDLPLMSGHVSRQHAVLEHDGTTVTLEDLGSKNGVYVNDEKVKRAEVTSRDKLTVGDFTLKIKLISGVSSRTPTPRKSPSGNDLPARTTMEGRFTHEMTPANMSEVMRLDESRTGAEHQLLDAVPVSNRSDIMGAAQPVEEIVPDVMSPPMHDPLMHGDEEDEHDDEAHFAAPYSLVDHVLRSPAGDTSSLVQPCVEVMTVIGDRVADFSLVRNRQTWRRYSPSARKVANGDGGVGLRSVHCRADGGCTVECDEEISGGLRRGHQDVDASRFFSHRGPDGCRGVLVPGDVLSLQSRHATFYLRYVTPAPVPVDTRSFFRRATMDGQIFNVFLASLMLHLSIMVLVNILTPEELPKEKTPEFVVTVKKDLTLQEPKPPPKPPPPKPPEPPKPPAPPSKPERHAQKRPRTRARPTKVAKATPKPVALPPNPAPPGILGLLSKKGATQAPGPVAAVQAVSNLAAVKTPGNSGSYRVSGLIGKMPTSSGISTGGGGGGVVTKGGAALLRGGGGAGRLSDQGNRAVGAMVQKGARNMRTSGGGNLDRALIEKVVNEHTDEIQRCYEIELAKDGSLQGKVEVEWVIGMDGSVTSARQKSSSVRSVGLSRCMLNAIHTWRFPHPQGGPVVVAFPFSFKGSDF